MYKELFLLLPPLCINVFHVTVALLARDTPLCAWKSDCTAQRYEFETNQTNKNG